MFSNCYNLNQNIYFPNNNNHGIDLKAAMQICTVLNQNIKIPSYFYSIRSMFWGSSNMNQNIYIPKYNEIQNSDATHLVFIECNNMTNVTIGTGYTNELNCFYGAFRINNSKSLNIWTDTITSANLIKKRIIGYVDGTGKANAASVPTWTQITNGYYNAYYNIYVYNNVTVFPD